MPKFLKTISLMLALFLVGANSATAEGSVTCERKPLSTSELLPATLQADKLHQELEAKDVEIAIVARVGSDISGKGLKYTHAGFALKNEAEQQWYFAHMLNRCGSDVSSVYEQSLLDFYLDDPYSYDTQIILLESSFGRELKSVIENDEYSKLVSTNYSMIAYPFSTEFTNSNSFVLETIALAQAKLEGAEFSTREAAQQYLRSKHFRGSIIRIYFLESLFGALFKENVSFRDHTKEERETGQYEFVSVKSVGEYVNRHRLSTKVLEIPGASKK